LGEHENRLLIDTIADEGSDTPEEAFLRSQELVDIESVMACLSERDATILRRYFGLGDDEALTLQGIGELLGLSKERVRQVKEKALREARKILGEQISTDNT
jgi:RNA polymerase primary sigma factor